MPLVLIPLFLLVVPILEIATFILVGRWIGLWPTLGLVVASAIVGAALLKHQGLSTLRRIQAEVAGGRVPGRELVHGVMIVAAGVLLLTPGLVTDVVGYLLFVPAVRDALWRFLGRRVVVATSTMGAGAPSGTDAGAPSGKPARRAAPQVVELSPKDYERHPDPASPWHGPHEGNRTLH